LRTPAQRGGTMHIPSHRARAGEPQEGHMHTTKRLLRAGSAVLVSAALMLPLNSSASADGTTGFDINRLPQRVRVHVSGMVDQALRTEAQAGMSSRPVNF